ncbi:MAG: butyrate kinase [Synergistaceae bacterium]|nr:butyrate kinase [Synergistaceae bacterium]
MTMEKKALLAVNPGSTGTKIAWFREGQEVWRENLLHSPESLATFATVADQFPYRLEAVESAIARQGESLEELAVVVGRGGIVEPIPGGAYVVDDLLVEHLHRGRPWEHPANLGGLIARALGDRLGIGAFIVDPVSVDELIDEARLTGLPELPKRSLVHALNIRATAKRAGRDLGRDWKSFNFIVLHLGGGISVAALRQGQIIDVNNANDFGPFSPNRAGGVPAGDLVRLCFSGRFSEKEILDRLAKRGGFLAYCGTDDLRELRRRIAEGDEKADLLVRAMVLQIAKEAGSMAAALAGDVDALILTGGMAYDDRLRADLTASLQWIAPVLAYPGEDEMSALAEGALAVLRGEEKARSYRAIIEGGAGRAL